MLVTEDRRNSPRKIDAAVWAILAFDRTTATAKVPHRSRLAFGF
jgi:hypothetical protein